MGMDSSTNTGLILKALTSPWTDPPDSENTIPQWNLNNRNLAVRKMTVTTSEHYVQNEHKMNNEDKQYNTRITKLYIF